MSADDPTAVPDLALDTAAVTRRAGRTVADIANWRFRHRSFPKPLDAGGEPRWSAAAIDAWLAAPREDRIHVISVINLKGGVGKTTTTVGIAEVLAHEHGARVLVVDLDPQTNASVALIGETAWADRDAQQQTVAQLFEDRLPQAPAPRFDIERAIVRGVSTINDGIAGLDLLPSSIRLVGVEDWIPMIALGHHYTVNPLQILEQALAPVLGRYDYVLIDCPPSLGVVTRNGLRLSTGYVIPTVPDLLSTWGIFQIVDNVRRFGASIGREIPALGIIATKVQANSLHRRVLDDLVHRRLGQFGHPDCAIEQPPLFAHDFKQTVTVANAGGHDPALRTLAAKYGTAADALRGLARELTLLLSCDTRSR